MTNLVWDQTVRADHCLLQQQGSPDSATPSYLKFYVKILLTTFLGVVVYFWGVYLMNIIAESNLSHLDETEIFVYSFCTAVLLLLHRALPYWICFHTLEDVVFFINTGYVAMAEKTTIPTYNVLLTSGAGSPLPSLVYLQRRCARSRPCLLFIGLNVGNEDQM